MPCHNQVVTVSKNEKEKETAVGSHLVSPASFSFPHPTLPRAVTILTSYRIM
jgi:hypothetical protein